MSSAPRTTMRSPSARPAAPRLEILRLAVAPDDRLAVAAAHHRVAVDDNAGDVFSTLGGDGDRLADPKRPGRLGDREIEHGRLLLQGAAPALERELHRRVAGAHGTRILERAGIVVAVVIGFDPQRTGIDDLEQHVLGRNDLSCHDAR
jgi:hypothetical protein